MLAEPWLKVNRKEFNKSIATLKSENKEIVPKLAEKGIYIDPHPFAATTLQEFGLFPFLHPKLTNIDQLEVRLRTILQCKYGNTMPFLIFRKTHTFGNDEKVRSNILAVKTERENVQELKRLFNEMAMSKYIGQKGTFLPHGYVFQIGQQRYKNILSQHNKHVTDLAAIAL